MGHVVVRTAFAITLVLGGPHQFGYRPNDTSPAPNPSLPYSVKLSDLEIGLALLGGGGGCSGRCMKYNVRVRGNGLVEFQDLGGEPRLPFQRRRVPVDDVVALVDAFVRARFFAALPSYNGSRAARRVGDSIHFDIRVMSDGQNWDLTLRLGTQLKTVRLYYDYPDELGRLRDMVDKMGGPQAWAAK